MSSQSIALDDTLGALFIGVIVASWLYGVTCLQALYYFTHQTKDPWLLKTLVSAVLILDTFHQILISHGVYTYVIKDFGNYPALEDIVWSFAIEVAPNGLVAFLVQSFLTARVWRLSDRNIWLTGVICMIISVEFVAVILFMGLTFRFRTFAEMSNLKTLSVSINGLAAGGDVLIAASLCIFLHKSRTRIHRTNTLINKLIAFSVSTGAVTSLCALASLISINIAGGGYIYIAFYFCIGRLYTNSLFATLNARKMMIRNATDGTENTDDELSARLRQMLRQPDLEI